MVKVNGKVIDPGCYADGSFGYDHIRSVLADLVEEFLDDSKLAEELRGPMSDDDSEALDAIDRLNEITVNGYWTLEDGDLLLLDDIEIVERTDSKLVLSFPLTSDESITEGLWWKDLYVYGDVVENDPKVAYIVDTAYMRVYWGYWGDTEFSREPDQEAEQEILIQLGFIGDKELEEDEA